MSLSPHHIDLIHDAAEHVAPAWRSRFMAHVVDRLATASPVTDNHVLSAVAHAVARFTSAPQCCGGGAT